MDLPVLKLIQPSCLAWHGSNKAVSLPFNCQTGVHWQPTR